METLNYIETLKLIRNTSSTNEKASILESNSNDLLLKEIIYLSESPKVKFWIKQIPTVTTHNGIMSLEFAIKELSKLTSRQFTGNLAHQHIENLLIDLTEEDADILSKIIQKDLKIGVGSKTFNSVYGKNFIEETPYMGAVSFKPEVANAIISTGKAVSQPKMDGRYCNAIISNGTVYLESRGGRTTFVNEALFCKELSKIKEDIVLNGELTMAGISRYESNGIIASLVSYGSKQSNGEDVTDETNDFIQRYSMTIQEALDKIIFTVWDSITINEYNEAKSNVKYNIRLNRSALLIAGLINVNLIETIPVKTYEEAEHHFKTLLNNNEEGTILKSLDGLWKSGKPKTQCKFKIVLELDLKIVDFNMGTQGTKNENLVSSVKVATSDELLVTNPAGMTESDMKFVTANQHKLLGTIVKVKCSGISKDKDGSYSLLHPVFVSLRDDKIEADSLETVINIEQSIKDLND